MNKLVIIVFLLAVVMINSGCPKPCIEANYSFSVNSQIAPDLDSVNVGDTIFLISSFPTKLIDQTTGQMIEYGNSTGVGSNLGIVKLINGNSMPLDAVKDFNFISVTGTIYNDLNVPNPNKFQQLKYQEVNNFYTLKIGISPKQKGTYSLGIGNGLSNGRLKNRNCEKASFSITLFNTNQHLSYFSAWNPNGTLGDYEKSRSFFLKVY